jgi:hypothetical protein
MDNFRVPLAGDLRCRALAGYVAAARMRDRSMATSLATDLGRILRLRRACLGLYVIGIGSSSGHESHHRSIVNRHLRILSSPVQKPPAAAHLKYSSNAP